MTEYRKILITSLARRQSANRAYSLRAFARDLRISPTSISLILSGQQGLSAVKAEEIANHLDLKGKEKDVFIYSVERHHSRNPRSKKLAIEKLIFAQAYFEKHQDSILQNWLSLPVLEYIRSHPKVNVGALANLFESTESNLKFLLNNLKAEKIISRKNSQWRVKKNYLTFGSEVPSGVIRQFHRESLSQAIRSIEEQSLSDRMLSTTIFNIDPNQKEKAFKALTEFRQNFCVQYNSGDKACEDSEVYSLSIQFFRTHRGSK